MESSRFLLSREGISVAVDYTAPVTRLTIIIIIIIIITIFVYEVRELKKAGCYS